MIEVIHATPRSTTITRKGVLTIAPVGNCSDHQPPEKKVKSSREPITFDDDDLEGTIQSYDDALVVIGQINDFLVKRVMVD